MKFFTMKRAMRAALLLLLMMAGVTKVFAQNEFMVDNIVYHPYNPTTAWVWGCNTGVTSLNVPSTVTYDNHTYTVTEIYQYAFKGNTTLTDVILPNSMTMIGEEAFMNCTSLTTVVLPEGLTTLNSGAFQGCSSLQFFNKRVGDAYISPNELPSTLTTIYINTFMGCTSLGSIRIPSGVTSIDGNAFKNCSNLENVYVYGLTTPTLGSDVFSGTSDELNIYVPAASEAAYEAATNWSTYASNIKAMPAHEFLTYTFDTDNHTATVSGYLDGIAGDLVIPDAAYGFNVTAIANKAFNQGTPLDITSVTFPQYLTSTGESTFTYCGNSLTTVDISRCTNLTEIAKRTFAGCPLLTSIKWNKTITTIGIGAFNSCGFTTMEIPNTVTSIGDYAFNYCSSLVSLTLPKSVSEIGEGAFQLNSHLQDVYSYRSVPPTIDEATFTSNESFNCTLHVPCADYGMYYDATGWKKFTNIVEMELNTLYYSYEESNHVATVVCYAGYPIGEVTIPETVTHNNETYTVTNIGEGAFRYAGSITKINLPSTIVAIDDYAFAGCNDLTSLTLPAVTSSIGEYVFQGCTGLEYIVALESTAPIVSEHSFDGLDKIPCYVSAEAYDSFNDNSYWHDNFILNRPGLIYNTETTTAVVAGCTPNYVGAIEIPATWGSFSVVGIKWSAFYNQPYITSISIPTSVTNIEFGAIMNCESLQNITVAAGNTAYKTDVTGALLTMDGKGLIAFPCGKNITSYDIPEDVEQTWHVFEGNKTLQTIYIPRSLRFYDNDFQVENAFYGLDCLTTLTVPSDHPYYQANNGVLLDKNGATVLYCPRGKAGSYNIPNTVTTIDGQAFRVCKNLTNVTIPNTVSSIESNAFNGCESLTSVVIPEGIVTNGDKTIGSAVFRNCTSLKSVTIPEGITTIGYGAFGNTGLLSLTLPSSLTDITQGFYDCVNLGEITCYAVNPPATDPQYVFDNVPEDIPVYVLAGSVNAYRNADGWSRFTNILAITEPNLYITYSYNDNDLTATVTGINPNYATGALVIPGTVQHNNATYTVTEIAATAFEECHGLTSVVIPHTVETIGTGAFRVCEGITELTIGRNVTYIGDYAFEACTGLETIHYYPVNCQTVFSSIWKSCGNSAKTLDIKNCVQSIPNNAFYNLQGLGSVTIPDSVTSIGDLAFSQSGLTLVTIGSNVKTLGYKAFASSGLTSVDLNNVETLGNFAFSSCANLATVTIRNSQQNIPESCFEDCTSLNNVHIPSGVRIIGNEAFKGCTSLTNLVFDNPIQGLLTTIGESAFEGCGLTSVDIPSTVTRVETWAFYGNTNLTTVTIGTGMQYMGSNLFYNCTNLATVNYNATHCNTIACSFGSTGNSTKTLHIGNNVNYIPGNAFAGLKLASVTIPNGVTVIGEYAFYGCKNITEINIPNSVTTIGYAAFADNKPGTITLGSGLTSIGDYAFGTDESTPYLETITSYNVTPPTIFEHTFNSIDYSNATLYVLGATAEAAYGSADYWVNFTNIQSLDGYYFTGTTDSNWSESSNWSNNTVPTSDPLIQYIGGEENEAYDPDFTPNVIILANATVDIPNAFANKLTIMDGYVVTVTDHNMLYIGNYGASFTAADASALVIEEGGQLWNDIDVQATVEKDIDGYNRGVDGWNFIASPLGQFYDSEANWLNPANVEGMIASTPRNYDLYLFDQSYNDAEWRNYKASQFGLRNGWGYLYANADDVTLKFAGTVKSNEYESQIDLEYTDQQIEVPMDPENPEAGYNYESYPFAGWNLIGNPFPCDAYIGGTNYGDYNYYKMNSTGSDIEAVASIAGTAIPRGTGILVQTQNSGSSSVTFMRELDPSMMSAHNNGNLSITLQQGNERGSSQIDNAIVSFNEGSKLEKFIFNEETSKIYIPQNGTDYAIVSSMGFGEMPLNFKVKETGTYTLRFNNEGTNFNSLYLIDKIANKTIDLTVEPSYTFVGMIFDDEARFTIVFNSTISSDSDIFAYQNGNEICVSGEGELQVFDVMGRYVASYHVNGVQTIEKPSTTGVYILRMNEKTQKIVVR